MTDEQIQRLRELMNDLKSCSFSEGRRVIRGELLAYLDGCLAGTESKEIDRTITISNVDRLFTKAVKTLNPLAKKNFSKISFSIPEGHEVIGFEWGKLSVSVLLDRIRVKKLEIKSES